ncbi:MAG TPA: FAD-dependent oxidoreductase [Bacteroidales bacterium]|nr:FAD-dependent oxidoreductase [Bacteroidales bacterium]
MNENIIDLDVLIVGGGAVGTALLYTISKYTNIKKVGLIEKYSDFGMVNCHPVNNSHTLHCGDIETNYTFEKAEKVKRNSYMLMKYLENVKKTDKGAKLFIKNSKMVLGVGKAQVEGLRERFVSFSQLFPKLRLIERDEIGKLEPKVVEGRDPDQEIVALATEDGYAVDFHELCHSFVEQAEKENPELKYYLSTKLLKVEKNEDLLKVKTNNGDFQTRVMVVSAGAHSLMIAKSLGYGTNLSILSVAGSYYTAPKTLNGKVYTIQMAKLPFAAIHGDAEVQNPDVTRFGPTAKPIFLLERFNGKTFLEYWKTFGIGMKPIWSLIKIISDKILFRYIFLNFFYDWPIIGKRLFIKQVKKIVPSIKLNELKYVSRVPGRVGGARPQIINNTLHKLQMGEAKLLGDNIIFNITPSPGASTCLGNAYSDTSKIIEFLGDEFKFDKEAFERDLV